MKKIAVNTVKTFLKEHETEHMVTMGVPVDGSSFDLMIKTHLTVAEKSMFINRVLSGCFDAAGNFRPEYVSPMIRATILQMCTNLPVLAQKGVQTENGESAMDMDAMNAAYMALDLDDLQDLGYQQMMGEIVNLCNQAIDWRRSRMNAGASAPVAEAVNAFGSAAVAVRSAAEELLEKVRETNMDELLGYVGQILESTKDLDADNMIKKLIELRAESGAVE